MARTQPYIPRSYAELLEMPAKPFKARKPRKRTLSTKEAKRRAHEQCRRYLHSRDMVVLQISVPRSFKARVKAIAARKGTSALKYLLALLAAAVNAEEPNMEPVVMEDLLPSAQPVKTGRE
jgi:hypothetical protein